MKVPCGVCGKLFEAKRAHAKFCGENCRQRAHRGGSGTAENTPPALKIAPEHKIHPLVAQTERELADAGVSETVLGQTALRLAEKLAGNFDTGSAMASLSREFRSVMAEALAQGTKKADGIDELTAWRLQKASGG